jgi:hypothetical protein
VSTVLEPVKDHSIKNRCDLLLNHLDVVKDLKSVIQEKVEMLETTEQNLPTTGINQSPITGAEIEMTIIAVEISINKTLVAKVIVEVTVEVTVEVIVRVVTIVTAVSNLGISHVNVLMKILDPVEKVEVVAVLHTVTASTAKDQGINLMTALNLTKETEDHAWEVDNLGHVSDATKTVTFLASALMTLMAEPKKGNVATMETRSSVMIKTPIRTLISKPNKTNNYTSLLLQVAQPCLLNIMGLALNTPVRLLGGNKNDVNEHMTI